VIGQVKRHKHRAPGPDQRIVSGLNLPETSSAARLGTRAVIPQKCARPAAFRFPIAKPANPSGPVVSRRLFSSPLGGGNTRA